MRGRQQEKGGRERRQQNAHRFKIGSHKSYKFRNIQISYIYIYTHLFLSHIKVHFINVHSLILCSRVIWQRKIRKQNMTPLCPIPSRKLQDGLQHVTDTIIYTTCLATLYNLYNSLAIF